MTDIKLYGRIIVRMNIRAVTGLHIGGAAAGMEIGGVDNPVIRDPITHVPYIPGSSLRGKMRSQLEKTLGLPQNNPIGQVKIHTCKTNVEYERNGGCPVCHIFGVPGEVEASGSTLLIVRDVKMRLESQEKLANAHTDLAFTELKTEVAIDRVTSAASPRNIERVPADAVFGPAEMVFSVYKAGDLGRFKHLVTGLQLLEDDYLGGSGSRGSGKVVFEHIEIGARNSKTYSTYLPYEKVFATLHEFEQDYPQLEAWAKQAVGVE
jgi:CRISPR-associated protein Csm3